MARHRSSTPPPASPCARPPEPRRRSGTPCLDHAGVGPLLAAGLVLGLSLGGIPLGASTRAGLAPITTEWVSPTSGAWEASENWSAGAPGELDTALFALGSSETIVVDSGSAVAVGRLLVRSGTVTLVAEAPFATNSATALLPSVLIGDTTAFAALEFDGLGGGLFTGHFMEIASYPNGSATCTIGAGTSLDLSGALSVGPRGSGVLTLHSSSLSSLRIVLGTLASGSGTALIQGGSASIEQTIVVGQKGEGTLEIVDAAVVTAAEGAIALDVFSSGLMTVSGAGTTVSFSETLDVGFHGEGVLEIVDGGTASTVGSVTIGVIPAGFFVPLYPGGDGRVEVLRGGTLEVGGDLFVTVSGIGKLVVGDGGRVKVSGQMNALAPAQAALDFRIGVDDLGDEALIDVAQSILGGGALSVSLDDAYVPAVGDTVSLMEAAGIGSSFTISLPVPPPGLFFDTVEVSTPERTSLAFRVLSNADLNGDGVIDAADLGVLLAAWGTSGEPSGQSDLDGNGIVDAADLGLLLAAFE